MRPRHVLAVLFLVVLGASCRQILGIEEAILICPEGLSDCAICSDPSDCPAATQCHRWACVDALCTPVNTPVHTPCSKGFCSNTSPSECVDCLEDGDCPGPDGHCSLGECFTCSDGVQNGNEWDVDCGGACKGCLGMGCTSPDECVSGICADLACCNIACTGTCESCSFPEPGNCTSIPMYQHDDNPACGGMYQCNGGGGCGLRPSEFCMSAVDCVTGRCVDNRCAKLPGEACNQPEECAKMSCVNGVCTM